MLFKFRVLALGLVFKLILSEFTPWTQVTMLLKVRVLALGLVFKVIMPFIGFIAMERGYNAI